MTKDVLISISGLQMAGEDTENVEIITAGQYYFKNDSHYIIYEEIQEGFMEPTKNMIKIKQDQLEIVKKGVTNANMHFIANEKKLSSYMTPFGELMIGLYTKQVNILEQADKMLITIDYELDINYDHVSDCHITMDIQSKAIADLSLQS